MGAKTVLIAMYGVWCRLWFPLWLWLIEGCHTKCMDAMCVSDPQTLTFDLRALTPTRPWWVHTNIGMSSQWINVAASCVSRTLVFISNKVNRAAVYDCKFRMLRSSLSAWKFCCEPLVSYALLSFIICMTINHCSSEKLNKLAAQTFAAKMISSGGCLTTCYLFINNAKTWH